MISRNCHQRNQALVQGLRIGLGHFGRVSLDWTGTRFFVCCQHTKLPSLFLFPVFIYTFRFSSRRKTGSRDTCSKYGLDFFYFRHLRQSGPQIQCGLVRLWKMRFRWIYFKYCSQASPASLWPYHFHCSNLLSFLTLAKINPWLVVD